MVEESYLAGEAIATNVHPGIPWPAPAVEKVINRVGVSAFLCRLGPPRPDSRGPVAG